MSAGPAPAVTVNIADAPAVLSASGVVTAPLLSVYTLGVLLVTLTLYVQVMPAGTTPTVSASVLPPAAAVSVPVQPAPVIAAPGVAVFTTPAGYVSVNATPVKVTAFELVSVIVSTDVAPVVIELGTKVLASASGVSTERSARSAIMMPLPAVTSKPAASISIAVVNIAVLICAAVREGLACFSIAAIDAAVGADADVPQKVPKVTVWPQLPAVMSTLLSVVPPPANMTLPGVMGTPAGV